MSARTELHVVGEGAPLRADQFVAHVLGISRRAAQGLCDAGRVRWAAGRRVAKGDRLSVGETLEVAVDDAPWVAADPTVRVRVVYADDALVVVEKPAGVPTHPLKPGELGTAANGAAALYPELRGVGPEREAGVVHRLDAGTSGLLVFARTAAAYADLRAAFSGGRVEKTYLALVVGAPPDEGVVRLPIGHAGRSAPRAEVGEGRGMQHAETEYRVVRRFAPPTGRGSAHLEDGKPITEAAFALLEARARTGRLHQVRAHLAAIGFPLAGDADYQDEAARARDTTGLSRPFLHAARLSFAHPATGQPSTFECALPPDLQSALERLAESWRDSVER